MRVPGRFSWDVSLSLRTGEEIRCSSRLRSPQGTSTLRPGTGGSVAKTASLA
jgi:hypothetical protein